ncbi:MAG: hypothetical protein HKN87_05635 [Saprospiraceae bacterium]|nr:hypothetical protein [Saprospiraceae bacterium]
MSTEMPTLRAGDLILKYDRGFLRYISFGKSEVLRMIYFALRDQNWETMDGIMENEVLEVSDDAFRISYQWISNEDGFPFRWDVQIEGKSNSEIEFRISGEALAAVKKNRTGFCILHPIKPCAGQPCEILDTSGEWSTHTFPKLISPHQPFFDIKGMRWNVQGAGEANLTFEGDTFETEDQRNWTDDSYKTYCTPLAKPFPVTLGKGEKVQQKVTLKFTAHEAVNKNEAEDKVMLIPAESILNQPKIGLGVSSAFYHLHPQEVEQLRILKLNHLRADIDLSENGWEKNVAHYLSEASQLGTDLMLAVFFDEAFLNQIKLLADLLKKLPRSGHLYLLLLHKAHKTTPSTLLDNGLSALRVDEQVFIGAGTNAYFTELNRETPELTKVDFVAYSVNPQVHAFDEASMTETLGGQAYTVESAQAFAPHLPIVVSPITLKPRFNPNATAPETAPQSDELPDAVDPRQVSVYAACWTLGSIAHLTNAGAQILTYFETVGWRGIMQGDRQVQMPDLFPAKRGMLFPVYHLLKELMTRRDHDWIYLRSSNALAVKGMMLRRAKQAVVLLANLHNREMQIELDLPVSSWRIEFYKGEALSASFEPFEPDPNQDGLKDEDADVEVILPAVSLSKISLTLK